MPCPLRARLCPGFDVTLGYCSGQVPGTGTIKYTEPESWVSGAIYIPAGTINTYAGNTITGVKAGLTSRPNMTELKVWLRSSLDGENLVEKTITKETDPKIAKVGTRCFSTLLGDSRRLRDRHLYRIFILSD